MTLSIGGLKGLAAGVIAVEGVLGAVIPFFVKRTTERRSLVFELLSAFTAGVFLATTFCHALPHLGSLSEHAHEVPVDYILMAAVYILLYGIDGLVHRLSERSGVHLHEHDQAEHQPPAKAVVADAASLIPAKDIERSDDTPHMDVSCEGSCFSAPDSQQSTSCERDPDCDICCHSAHTHAVDTMSCSLCEHIQTAHGLGNTSLAGFGELHVNDIAPHEVLPEPEAAESKHSATYDFTGCISLAIAISLHSIFAGLAIGAADSTDAALALLIAVIAHKWADSAIAAIAAIKAQMHVTHAAVILAILAAAAPLGIGIGALAHGAAHGESVEIIEGVAHALTAGAFLFVALNEIVPATLHRGKDLHWRSLAVLLGATLMVTLMVLTHNEHGHEHEHE